MHIYYTMTPRPNRRPISLHLGRSSSLCMSIDLFRLTAKLSLVLIFLQTTSLLVICTPVYEVVDYDTDNGTTASPAAPTMNTRTSSPSPSSRRPSLSPTPSSVGVLHPTFHDLSSHAGTLFCSEGEFESDEIQQLLSEWLEDTFLLQLKVIFLDARGYSCADFARDQDVLGHDSLPALWKALMHHVMRHRSLEESADSYQFFALRPGSALVTELHNTVNCNFVPGYCRALKHVGEKLGVNRRALAAFAPSIARLYRSNHYQHAVRLRNEEAAYVNGHKNGNTSTKQQQLLNSSLLLKDPAVDAQVNAWVDFQLSALTSPEMSCHDLIQNYSNYARLATNVSELVELEAIGPLWMSRSGENVLQRQAHMNWCSLVKDFASKAPMNISVAAMRNSSPQLITTISENRQMRTRTRFTFVTLIMLGIVGLGILSFIAFKAVGLYVVHRVDQFMQLRRQSAQELRSFRFTDNENDSDLGGGDHICLSARSPYAETRSL